MRRGRQQDDRPAARTRRARRRTAVVAVVGVLALSPGGTALGDELRQLEVAPAPDLSPSTSALVDDECGKPCAVVPVALTGSMPPLGGTTGSTAADNAERSRLTLLHALRWAHTHWWDVTQDYDAQPVDGPLTLPSRGLTELTLRPNGNVAFATAIALKTGVWSEADTGVPAATALDRTLRLVCAMAGTHRANGGTTWGGEWQAPLWAGFGGYAGWLLWSELGAHPAHRSCQEPVRRMVEHEANRVLDGETPAMYTASGQFISPGYETRSEENSWSLQIFSLADVMMPDHPQGPAWRSRSVEYAVSAFASDTDARTNLAVVNGLQVKRWISGYNVLPDKTIVNHGIVNPDYMVNIAHHNAMIYYKSAGASAPEAFWFGQERNFDTLVGKHFTAGWLYGSTPTGAIPGTRRSDITGTMLRRDTARVFYPHGADWGTRRSPQYWVTVAHADDDNMDFGGDDRWEAAFSKDAYAMQQRFGDGRTFLAGSTEDRYSNATQSHETLAVQQYASIWASKWLAHNAGGIATQDTSSVGLLVDNSETLSAYPVPVRKKWMQVHPRYRAWASTTTDPSKVGKDALVAARNRKRVPTAVARFHASLPAGTYAVYSSWPRAADRATNAKYVVVGAGGDVLGRRQVDQRTPGDAWERIGTYAFPDGNHYVEINNSRTNGRVVADGIRFVRQ